MPAATFTSTMPGASSDYMRSLYSNPVKTNTIKGADLLDFSLAAGVPGFVKLKRGAYIDINSSVFPHWFTGYVTNDPQPTYLGSRGGVPAWGYTYQATGDEYLLSLNTLGLVRPFMNVHMGTVLKRLVDLLAPGIFDVSNIQDGPLLAQYIVDPTQHFFNVSADLCAASNFVFFGKNHKLYFMRQDDSSLPAVVVDGNNKHFTPSRLNIKPSAKAIINDAIVLGQIEPQKYMTEYFLGTGLEGSFPLAASVFGVDTCLLLQDNMTGTSLNSTVWTSNDTSNSLTVANGYLNIGYPNSGPGVYLQSAQPIPLEGNIRLTHGEWDFLSGSGIICALYKQTPSSGAVNCVYGLRATSTTLKPVVNGIIDPSQSFTIDHSKRYVIRTLATFSKMHRLVQPYSYMDSSGVVQTLGGETVDCKAEWHTIITEVDPTTGKMTKQVTFVNVSDLDGTAVFATYVAVFSSGLHATVSGITVSVPVNATLAIATVAPILNANFDKWASQWVPSGWAVYSNVVQESVYQDGTGSACKFYVYPPEPNNPIILQQSVAAFILPNTQYNFTLRVRCNPSLVAGLLVVTLTGTNADGSLLEGDPTCPGLNVDMTTQGDYYTTVSGVLTTGLNVVPADLNLVIELLNAPTNVYASMFIDNLHVETPFYAKLLGPNEIDSMDGLSPYATITSSNTGAPTVDSIFGSSQFNPGQSQLVFFKNSVNLTSNTPTANQTVRLTYRSAGPAIGRVVSESSIATEAAIWGDDGHRGVIQQNLTPRPRNSYECELAASAIVSQNLYNHYEGDYTQFSSYFTSEPRAGGVFQLINIPTISSTFAAEQITSVKTTFLCNKFSPGDLFSHVVSFAVSDSALQQVLDMIGASTELYQNSSSTATNPVPVDLSLVGLNYADDVPQPRLINWDANSFNLAVGPVSAPVELRSTDMAWGVPATSNYIGTTSSSALIVFGLNRVTTVFMKQVS